MRRWPTSRPSPGRPAIKSTGWSTRSTSWWAAIPRPPSTLRVQSCDFSIGVDGDGFWSVATYAETLAVFRDPQTYSSVTGGSRPSGGTLLQDLPISGQVLNMMDDPRHSEIRRLVSSGLTPRMITRVENDLR